MPFETIVELVEKVAQLPPSDQGSIFRVLVNHHVPYTRNANGIFVLAQNLKGDVIRDIEAHITDAEQQRRQVLAPQPLSLLLQAQQQPMSAASDNKQQQGAKPSGIPKKATIRSSAMPPRTTDRNARAAAMARFMAAVSSAGTGSNASAATAAAVRRTSRFALARKRYARPCAGSAYGHPAALAHAPLTLEGG